MIAPRYFPILRPSAKGSVVSNPPDGNRLLVRRRILAILVSLSLFSYLLRMNISVAQHFMVPELGLSDIQVVKSSARLWWGMLCSKFLPAFGGITGGRASS